ncbi:MAG: tRNA (adenosine(37)-N6)-threonylcarbamoyltransferase complex ATPase subunit type 1 TsaE [Candidatus Krumholzibacteriia bacterium]
MPQPIPDPAGFTALGATASPARTAEFGGRAAGLLRGGDALLLWGPLGAGKTLFTQGLCRGLGVTDEVVSPTYNLACRYAGRLTVHHLDFYRVGPDADLADIGVDGILEELDAGNAVLVAEWPLPLLPLVPRRLELLVLPGAGPDDRRWFARGAPRLPDAWRTLLAAAPPC